MKRVSVQIFENEKQHKMADCEFRDFCLIFRAWIFDILWPLCEKAGQIISIVYLVQREQYKWAIMMSVAMAIPGFLGN